MLHEEFERLLQTLAQAEAGQNVSLEMAINEAIALFDHIKENLEKANPEERKVLTEELKQMQLRLSEATRKVSEKTGMSEEQIMAASDKPDAYSPEEWRLIQHAKDKLLKSGNVIHKMIYNAETKERGKENSKKVHKTQRSDWLKS